jgi:hypothetical protein
VLLQPGPGFCGPVLRYEEKRVLKLCQALVLHESLSDTRVAQERGKNRGLAFFNPGTFNRVVAVLRPGVEGFNVFKESPGVEGFKCFLRKAGC